MVVVLVEAMAVVMAVVVAVAMVVAEAMAVPMATEIETKVLRRCSGQSLLCVLGFRILGELCCCLLLGSQGCDAKRTGVITNGSPFDFIGASSLWLRLGLWLCLWLWLWFVAVPVVPRLQPRPQPRPHP